MSTSNPWHLIEPCAGSAALTCRYLGLRPLVPYQGGKGRLSKALAAFIAEHGFEGPPVAVTLTDPGPWGVVWELVPELRHTLELLEAWNLGDPEDVFNTLNRAQLVDRSKAWTAAAFLFLQRLTYAGKAVGFDPDFEQLQSVGINRTSAYGREATESFGEIKPMIPCLIRRVRKLAEATEKPPRVVGFRKGAEGGVSRGRMLHRSPAGERRQLDTVYYFDPPYQGRTGYPNGTLSRDQLVALAVQAADPHALVMVSESEPIQELVDLGWSWTQLRGGSDHGSPFRSAKSEVVTFLHRTAP